MATGGDPQTWQPSSTAGAASSGAQQQQQHPYTVKGQYFDVGARYSDLKFIGEGAYGMVVSAFDRQTDQKVAIKKMFLKDHATFTRRTLREIRILTRVSHDAIVEVIDLIAQPSAMLSEAYMVLPLMETDLNKTLKAMRKSDSKLPATHIVFWSYQLIRALLYLHSAGIVHRDLKPANILINPTTNCDLKLCDFGLSRVIDPEKPPRLSEYVATRWYRAPEVLLTPKFYTQAMDMWSAGCILAEMLTSRPLLPGKDAVDQMNKTLNVIGTPSEEDLSWIPLPGAKAYMRKLPFTSKADFNTKFPGTDPSALDLLDQMLQFSPVKRITAKQALSHEYFVKSQYHDPDDEPVAPAPLRAEEFEVDDLPLDKLKECIVQEVRSFRTRHTTDESGDVQMEVV